MRLTQCTLLATTSQNFGHRRALRLQPCPSLRLLGEVEEEVEVTLITQMERQVQESTQIQRLQNRHHLVRLASIAESARGGFYQQQLRP